MRFFSYSILISTLFFVPFSISAQTATSTFDIDAYIDNMRQVTNDMMVQQEKNFINPQKIRTKAITDYLDVKANPQNPGPNETIHVNVESYLSDLNKATIRWSVNGKTIDHGIGKTAFSFKNGGAGVTTRLTISITTNAGENITKELTFSPVDIIVLWEANTYTPPFYKGKPLMTAQSSVRAVVIPNTATSKGALTASNLVFKWEKDGAVVKDSSGYNKNFFLFEAPKPYGEINLHVKISSLDDTARSDFAINIPLSKPIVLFYENRPLLGVLYNHPIDTNLALSAKEFSLKAEPYFFSNESPGQQINFYQWLMDGKLVGNSSRTITFRNDKDAEVRSAITFSAQGVKRTFQTAQQSVVIHFTPDQTSVPQF